MFKIWNRNKDYKETELSLFVNNIVDYKRTKITNWQTITTKSKFSKALIYKIKLIQTHKNKLTYIQTRNKRLEKYSAKNYSLVNARKNFKRLTINLTKYEQVLRMPNNFAGDT